MNFKSLTILAWTGLSLTTFAAQQSSQANRVYGDELFAGPNGTFLSDHYTIDTRTPINQDNLYVASSNSAGRGSPNGFGVNESPQQTDARMTINIQRVMGYLKNHPNTFYGLQEWNSLDIPNLNWALSGLTNNNTMFQFDHTNTVGASFNHGLIYNQALYQLLGQSSSTDLPEINSLSAFNSITGALQGNQTGRYLHLTLKHKYTQQEYHVINVHLRWQTNPQLIVTALDSIFNKFLNANIIIMGDFNADLSFPLINAAKLISTNGSFSFDQRTKSPKAATNDAILYRLNATQPAQYPQQYTSAYYLPQVAVVPQQPTAYNIHSNPDTQRMLGVLCSINSSFSLCPILENYLTQYFVLKGKICDDWLKQFANLNYCEQEKIYSDKFGWNHPQ